MIYVMSKKDETVYCYCVWTMKFNLILIKNTQRNIGKRYHQIYSIIYQVLCVKGNRH